MAKIAVCDDDSQIRDLMSSYLSSFDSCIHVDFYSSGEDLLDVDISYDVLFLDIDMKGITPAFIVIFIPLYLSYFAVSMIVNQIAIKLLEIRQAREATNYNIGNG